MGRCRFEPLACGVTSVATPLPSNSFHSAIEPAQVDHLVVCANTLAEGVDWCQATLGIVPGPGGEHARFGTHNRLFNIASPQYPGAYFEIIAINKEANYQANTRAMRWFDMDDEALRAQLAVQGPQLIHWVARVPQVNHVIAALAALGIDRGPATPASRATPKGPLQWQITVRPDGRRLFNGCLPTLIQWGDVHPVDSLPVSGVALQSLSILHPQAPLLCTALRAIGFSELQASIGQPELSATLVTPKGNVRIASAGL
jgi:hypothetical protein